MPNSPFLYFRCCVFYVDPKNLKIFESFFALSASRLLRRGPSERLHGKGRGSG